MFLAYLGWISLSSIAGYGVYHFWAPLYSVYYWSADFVALVLGFGVTWELGDRILSPYPGARRIASMLLSLLLVAIVSRAALNLSHLSPAWRGATTVEVQRYFRFTQAVLMGALACILYQYRIPLGRCFGGIFLGYGCYSGLLVIGLAARSHLGGPVQQLWQLGQQAVYIIVLIVWCRALWYGEPSRQPCEDVCEEYSVVYRRTTRVLSEMRRSLLWLSH